MTNEVEKLLEQKELYTKKHAQGLRREQARQLRYQKVSQQIRADRNKELVTTDFEARALAEFDDVYEKLMGDETDKLDDRYVGRKLALVPSLNKLSHIKERYENEEVSHASNMPQPTNNSKQIGRILTNVDSTSTI